MEILDFCTRKLQAAGLASSGNKFQIFYGNSTELNIEVQDGKVETLTRSTDQALAIRTLRDQKMGFSYTFDLSKDAVERAISTALEVGDLMKADPLNDLCTFGEYPYAKIESFDESGVKADTERKIAITLELETAAKRFDPRIKLIRKSGFDQSYGQTIMVDHQGERIQHRASMFSAYQTCIGEDPSTGQSEMGSDGRYSNFLDQLDSKSVSMTAAKNALELLGAGKAATMQCPAVFKNSVVAQMLGFLSASFSAENIEKNFSLLTGKLGKKVFSELINVTDDGLLPAGVATAPFDADGVPAQKTKLITNGTVSNYLYDMYYARKHKTKSTGSSRMGSFKSSPSIGMSNLVFENGSRSFEQLLTEASNGIYITSVMGLHTANPITGDFSLGASGILIEGGKLTRPVKGFAIAGNMLDLLSRVSAVGNDSRSFGSIWCPAFMVSEISIGGA